MLRGKRFFVASHAAPRSQFQFFTPVCGKTLTKKVRYTLEGSTNAKTKFPYGMRTTRTNVSFGAWESHVRI